MPGTLQIVNGSVLHLRYSVQYALMGQVIRVTVHGICGRKWWINERMNLGTVLLPEAPGIQ